MDLNYKEYSRKQLDEWVNNALNCEDFTAQELYDTIIKSVKENVEYHQKELDRGKKLLFLLKGNLSANFEATEKDWSDFWEESYYPEEFKQYTEDEMDAMCDVAAEQEERDKCREYNLREAEYYNKRAIIDAQHKQSKKVDRCSVNGLGFNEYDLLN